MWPMETKGAWIGERLLSARRGLAEVARRRLGSGLVGEAQPTSARANRSAAEMLLTVAVPTYSDLMIVVAMAAEEAGTIADDEAAPGTDGCISFVAVLLNPKLANRACAARELKASWREVV